MDNGHNTPADTNPFENFSFSGGAGVDSIKNEGISNDPDNLNSSNFNQPSSPAISSQNIGANVLSSSDNETLDGHALETPINQFLPPERGEQLLPNSQNSSIPEIPINSLNPDILSPTIETNTETEHHPQSNNPAGQAENITLEFNKNGVDPAKYFEEISGLKNPEGENA